MPPTFHVLKAGLKYLIQANAIVNNTIPLKTYFHVSGSVIVEIKLTINKIVRPIAPANFFLLESIPFNNYLFLS